MIKVAIGVLIEAAEGGQRVLIARRQERSVLGGYWEFPGGKVEDGESVTDCLVREFEEELGIRIAVGEALPIIEHNYEHGSVRLHPFYCSRDSGEAQSLQVAEYR